MNVENLCEVFENFKNDNNRAILVDGPWGVGKTYQILQFLKRDSSYKKNENKIIYVTLFGKTTIDEIHTDIYSKLHPIKNGAKKVVQIIPKVAPLFGTVGNIVSNMEFALNTNEQENDSIGKNIEKAVQGVQSLADNINAVGNNKKTIKKTKNKTIVILDDLERIDSEKMPYGDLLGYINNLFLQNIKVIVVCNSKEINGNDFTSFKEKVIDREYKISATNPQIIVSYFDEYSFILKDYIIEEFDNNLRIALRVSNFYKEVIKQLSSYNKKYYEKISNEVILFYCALVVTGCNSKKYTDAQNKPDAKKHLLFTLSDDENIQSIAQSICNYLENKQPSAHIFDSLIVGLLEGYYYNTYDRLAPIFVDVKDLNDPFFEESFCLSDDEKKLLFTRQFEKIKDVPKISSRRIMNVIDAMCRYEKFSDIDNREDVIIENLLEKGEEKEIHYLMELPFGGCKRYLSFSKKMKSKYDSKQISTMVNNLNDSYRNGKYTEVYDFLGEIERMSLFAVNNNLHNDILNAIKSNNFFIENLFDTIEMSQWEVAHKICEVAVRFGFTEDVAAYIKSLDYEDDNSAKERYDFLLTKKLEGKN
jgi:hypothetical protein